jgi:phosphate:Na+ symporter
VAIDLIGGVGVFLLGMVLLTEGLKAMAGGALRRGLARFTRGRLAAVATGAVATALVQSSSATTMTTIGLVAAGLLPMVSAVGVILGANLGTTSTAWIVAYFGLKLNVSSVAMLFVAVGALVRLLGRGRIAAAGLPMAGFGLLFVGIGLMQAAMADLADGFVIPSASTDDLGGMLLLVAIGAAMTVIMQASGAAVATTLTALAAGAIGLEQAAALVIGQNLGTTPKALLASIGASTAARRTAVAHVVFNLLTGVVALGLLAALARFGLDPDGALARFDPAMVIAGFHSLFNVVGVALFLPWLPTFAALVARLVPDRGPPLTRHLGYASVDEPALAVQAARTTLLGIAAELGDAVRALATRAGPARVAAGARARLAHAIQALEQTHEFLAKVRTSDGDPTDRRRHVSVLHALDHLQRAAQRLAPSAALARFAHAADVRPVREALDAAVVAMVDWCPVLAPEAPADGILERFQGIPGVRRRTRVQVLRRVAEGSADADDAEETLEALTWAQAIAHNLERAVHHLREPAPGDES